MKMYLNSPGRALKPGDRIAFVRNEEVAEGILTIASIDGLKITFAEKMPVGVRENDTLIPEAWLSDPDIMAMIVKS